jgi:DNA modification methylase
VIIGFQQDVFTANEDVYRIRAQIIWAKERLVIGCGDYSWQHEPCWYAVRSKGYWTGDRKQTTLWSISSGNQDCQTPHITQKPVECMRRPMQNNSGANQTVYDPFLGSGTTLIAAETIERVCLGMELEPRFVDVAIRRWQAFTGKDAVRLDDGKPFNDIAAEYPIAESARRRRSAKRRTSRTNKS